MFVFYFGVEDIVGVQYDDLFFVVDFYMYCYLIIYYGKYFLIIIDVLDIGLVGLVQMYGGVGKIGNIQCVLCVVGGEIFIVLVLYDGVLW